MLAKIMLSGSTSIPICSTAPFGSPNHDSCLSTIVDPNKFGIMKTAISQPRKEKITTVTPLTVLPVLAIKSESNAPIAGKIHESHGTMSEFQNIHFHLLVNAGKKPVTAC